MASPTAGVLGTTAVIFNATGADTTTPVEMTAEPGGTLSNFQRLSNQIAPASVGNNSRASFSQLGLVGPVQQELWGQLQARGANGTYFDFIARYTPGTGISNQYFIEAEIDFAATDFQQTWSMVNGTPTQVTPNINQAWAANDWYNVTWVDSGADIIISHYIWPSAGSAWSLIHAFTAASADANQFGSHYLGMEAPVGSAVRFGSIMGGVPSGHIPRHAATNFQNPAVV